MELLADSTIQDLLIEAGRIGEKTGENPVYVIVELNSKKYRMEVKVVDLEMSEDERQGIRTLN